MRRHVATAALAAGLAIGGIGGAMIGIPALSGAEDTTTSASAAKTSHQERLRDALQPLVDAGTIDASQRDAVIEALIAARQDHRDDHGRRWGRARRSEIRSEALGTAASTIGVAEEDLEAAIRDGSSIAEVARSHGVDPQAVVDALVDELRTHLAEKVQDGSITQEEADAMVQRSTETITSMVNGERPWRMKGGAGRGHHGEEDDHDEQGHGSQTTTTTAD